MASYTNNNQGPRGINLSDGSIQWVNPGETVEVDDDKAVAHADLVSDDEDEVDELARMSVADLTKDAEELGVLPTEGSGKDGKVVKADIIAAIRAALADAE